MVKKKDLHQVAHILYGRGKPASVYITCLARDLEYSYGGINKIWYRERQSPLSANFEMQLAMLLEKRAGLIGA